MCLAGAWHERDCKTVKASLKEAPNAGLMLILKKPSSVIGHSV
jgi:hypothetical protein